MGRDILVRQEREGWGAKVIDRLAADLKKAFPEMNVSRPEISNTCAHPRHVKDTCAREWYVRATFEHGWSRDVLVHQLESGAHKRVGAAITNFARTLPAAESDLAQQITKDPYTFDFLMIGDDAHERELDQGLLAHLRDFLLELGIGFAFVASQYRLDVGGRDFFIDLLFYQLKLRCFVVIDLKAKAFEPEFVGKMNFYLAAVDDLLRHPEDRASVGLIICKTKDQIAAEYALRNFGTPIGISEYKLSESLPPDLKEAWQRLRSSKTNSEKGRNERCSEP
ncbi:MAG: PDDEXK nuclease domain-containing protein [Bryobacteraceae bacterium]